jgi:hypothetical protein
VVGFCALGLKKGNWPNKHFGILLPVTNFLDFGGYRACSDPCYGRDAFRDEAGGTENPRKIYVKEIPKCFVGQVFFWRPGAPKQNNHTFSGEDWFLGHAAFGGKATQNRFS